MTDSERDPALGHPDDFPDEPSEQSVETTRTQREGSTGSVIGVPLKEGEQRVHECHPSWWMFLPEMLLTGVMYGVVGTLLTWLYTPLISISFPPEVVQAFDSIYATTAQVVTAMGYNMSSEFGIPWWAWVLLFVVASYPVMKAYLKARFTHFVITTDRVMSIQTFPGKTKDWAEIQNLRSFTSDADFLEQRLGVGSVKFQPANEDPIVFNHIDDYEYWETEVKEIQKQKNNGQQTAE